MNVILYWELAHFSQWTFCFWQQIYELFLAILLFDAVVLMSKLHRWIFAHELFAEWVQVVNVLCEAENLGSVINKKDEEGWTPLHSAASIGNAQIVEILLSKGEYFYNWIV